MSLDGHPVEGHLSRGPVSRPMRSVATYSDHITDSANVRRMVVKAAVRSSSS